MRKEVHRRGMRDKRIDRREEGRVKDIRKEGLGRRYNGKGVREERICRRDEE